MFKSPVFGDGFLSACKLSLLHESAAGMPSVLLAPNAARQPSAAAENRAELCWLHVALVSACQCSLSPVWTLRNIEKGPCLWGIGGAGHSALGWAGSPCRQQAHHIGKRVHMSYPRRPLRCPHAERGGSGGCAGKGITSVHSSRIDVEPPQMADSFPCAPVGWGARPG